MDQSHSLNGREKASTTLAAKNASKILPKLAACVGFAAHAAKNNHSILCGKRMTNSRKTQIFHFESMLTRVKKE